MRYRIIVSQTRPSSKQFRLKRCNTWEFWNIVFQISSEISCVRLLVETASEWF